MGQPDLSGNFRGYQESNIMQKFRNLQRGNVTERKVIFLHEESNLDTINQLKLIPRIEVVLMNNLIFSSFILSMAVWTTTFICSIA